MDKVTFHKTADGKLEYCLDKPRNRIIIVISYTAKKSFHLIIQKVLINLALGKVEVIRVKHKTIIGMTIFLNDPANTFAIFDEYQEQEYSDKVIKMLWNSVSTNRRLDEVLGINEVVERN